MKGLTNLQFGFSIFLSHLLKFLAGFVNMFNLAYFSEISHISIEEEAISMSVFYDCICDFPCIAAVSNHVHVASPRISIPMKDNFSFRCPEIVGNHP